MYGYVLASDPARARQFHDDKLGSRTKQEHNSGVIYAFGGTACFLYPTPNAGTTGELGFLVRRSYWRADPGP